jgi:hypothetical protein
VCVCQWSVNCIHESWVSEWSINLFTNPNPVCSHSYTWQYSSWNAPWTIENDLLSSTLNYCYYHVTITEIWTIFQVLSSRQTHRIRSHETRVHRLNIKERSRKCDLRLLYSSGIFMVMKCKEKCHLHYHYTSCSLSWLKMKQVKVKVTLRLTVSQSDSQSWCQAPSVGPTTRYLLLYDSYGLVLVGRPLWREDGSVFFYVLRAHFNSMPSFNMGRMD